MHVQGKLPVHTPAVIIRKVKANHTFEIFGDVEAEGKSDTLGIVDAETQSKQ